MAAFRKTELYFAYFCCFSAFVFVCGGTITDFFPNHIVGVSGKSSGFLLTEGKIQSDYQAGDYTTECEPLVHDFSNASAAFILCAAKFSKPLRFCELCDENYSAVINSVDEIEQNTKCRDTILNSDVLQIVKRTRNFVEGLWDQGNCENCFADQKIGGPDAKRTFKLSNDTLKFWEYFNDVQECFISHNTSEDDFSGKYVSNSTLCQECHDKYCKLNTFYKKLGASSKLCMDIVEMMNLTRQQWSNDFHCIIHTKDTEVVVTLSVLFCCIPVVFYLVAMVVTKKHVIKRPYRSAVSSGEGDSSVSQFGTNVR